MNNLLYFNPPPKIKLEMIEEQRHYFSAKFIGEELLITYKDLVEEEIYVMKLTTEDVKDLLQSVIMENPEIMSILNSESAYFTRVIEEKIVPGPFGPKFEKRLLSSSFYPPLNWS